MTESRRPYADAARGYWGAGWTNPIPVQGKEWPPAGFTGYDGVHVTWPDMQAWLDGPQAGHNIALRLAVGTIGVDVDAYDGKVGATSLAAAEAALGPLPASPRSTSRDPGGASGIRFYRVPLALDLRGAEKRFRARFGEHVDIIRHDHRYAIVWPSVHPETRAVYRWYDEADVECAVPRVADLPELPAPWCEFLAAALALTGPTGQLATIRPTGGATTIWDEFPREFTMESARAYVRQAIADLRSAPNGTINNRLNDAAVTVSHFVPAFWSVEQVTAGLLEALKSTVYDGRTWRAETTIASGLSAKTWKATRRADAPAAVDADEAPRVRRVDLTPWLDGSWKPPQPSHGALRDDGRALLYPGRWHTLVGPNESGKTWLELIHARDELLNHRRAVVMVHFEESLPGGTVARLLGIDVPVDVIRERFVWLACDRQWAAGEMAVELAQIDQEIGLVILDGINAACTSHGYDPKDAPTVGWYRRTFVSPATRLGAAVLSAGHPVKDRTRQDERHGFGSTAWLDEVDGVAFRLMPGKTPIRKGSSGTASLHVVKDRYGEVSSLATEDKDGWRYVGSVVVDDTVGRGTSVRLSAPQRGEVEAVGGDKYDVLAEAILAHLAAGPRGYDSQNQLNSALRAARVSFANSDLNPALRRLVERGHVEERIRGWWLVDDYEMKIHNRSVDLAEDDQ